MLKLKRVQIFGKLDQLAYKGLESATVLCKTRGNPYVELVHFLNQILLGGSSDVHEIIRYFALDEAKISKDMVAALDRLPRGASSISDFASNLETAIREGWMATSLVYQESSIRTGHLLLAIKQNQELSRYLNDVSQEFVKINGDLLQEKFNVDQVYQFLLYFDKLYAHFTDSEKKKFLNSFIDRIEIYPEEQPDGRLVRSIRFKFPVWFGEGYTSDLSWDNETTVSQSICFSKGISVTSVPFTGTGK